MKNILLVILFLALSNIVFAQSEIPRNYKGGYEPYTLLSKTGISEGDSTKYVNIPFDVSNGIFYFNVSKIATSDSIKTANIQGSGDKITWYNLTTFQCFNNPVTQRIVVNALDRYIRLLYTIGGPHPDIDFKVIFYPKH